MTSNPLAQAAGLIEQAFALISTSPDPLSNLLVLHGVVRQAERVTVSQIAVIERDGSLAEKGYRTTTAGLKGLLGWDHDTARRHATVAQHVEPRVALDGSPLEPVLPATAAAFTAGAITVRHVEVSRKLKSVRGVHVQLVAAGLVVGLGPVGVGGVEQLSAHDADLTRGKTGQAAQPTPGQMGMSEVQTPAPCTSEGPEADRPDRHRSTGNLRALAARCDAEWFGNGSRVTRECHARFYERRRVRFPPPTHHDQVHDTEWTIDMPTGTPRFVAPEWLDTLRAAP